MVKRVEVLGRTKQEEQCLPLRRAVELDDRAQTGRWLIEDLWGVQATGLLGAEPKCCKTWLALDMAVSVATGKPCLRQFAVPDPGPVLYFPAEDAQYVVRERVGFIAKASGLALEDIPVQFLTPDTLHLDERSGQDLLRAAIERVQPKLVVLDPFVRLHQGDENSAAGVGVVLGYLRELQRTYSVSVLLVHHMKKSSGKIRPGQALRGSGDLHAWGDANLFLARRDGRILLTAEHRASPGFEQLILELRGEDGAVALHAAGLLEHFEEEPDVAPDSGRRRTASEGRRPRRDVAAEVEGLLKEAGRPLQQRELREHLKVRMSAIGDALRALTEQGRVHRLPEGYTLQAPVSEAAAASAPQPEPTAERSAEA